MKEVVLKHLLNYSYFPYTHTHTHIELQEDGADWSESRRERHVVYIGHIRFHLHHAETRSQNSEDKEGGRLKAYNGRQVNRHMKNPEAPADRGVFMLARLSHL